MVSGRLQRGFTAAEILIVLAIVALIAMFAFPAMTSLMAVQGVRSSSYDLFADLTYARSEAIARGANVAVTAASGTDWKQGWKIESPVAGGALLRSQPARGSAIVFTGSDTSLTFDRTGRATSGATITWNIVPTDSSANDSQKRCVRLDPSGRARSVTGACV
jgi:type IV fimbrial biogenesis protein FimT